MRNVDQVEIQKTVTKIQVARQSLQSVSLKREQQCQRVAVDPTVELVVIGSNIITGFKPFFVAGRLQREGYLRRSTGNGDDAKVVDGVGHRVCVMVGGRLVPKMDEVGDRTEVHLIDGQIDGCHCVFPHRILRVHRAVNDDLVEHHSESCVIRSVASAGAVLQPGDGVHGPLAGSLKCMTLQLLTLGFTLNCAAGQFRCHSSIIMMENPSR